MLLSKLLEKINPIQITGGLDLEISGITDDSRKVETGNLFVAIPGLTVDAHKYIPQAIAAGAIAVIGEVEGAKLDHLEGGLGITYIQVKNSRHSLGITASEWFENPSRKLIVIGITGTEGKTTTCSLIYHLLQSSGKKTGLISTIGARIGEEFVDTGLHVTNPEALLLQELLKRMVDEECEYAVLETTSIGLHQGRVAGVQYDTAVLTNITSDHLDYHKTKDAYREAKSLLFEDVNTAVLNKDDDSFEYIKERLHKNTKLSSYGVTEKADFKAENIQPHPEGFKFAIYHKGQEVPIKTQLLGLYNVSNVLASIATAQAYNLPFSVIKPALESFVAPEGRLERIEEGQPFSVFVDFAHTANSIKNTLQTLREITPKDKKLIAVYGSAGLRDAEKRPEMGYWGGKLADITIFTADDPRTERVDDIIEDIAKGAQEAKALEVSTDDLLTGRVPVKTQVFAELVDRRQAISTALSIARKGDVVALLGKGHEKSMAIGNEEIPWSDQQVAREVLKGLG